MQDELLSRAPRLYGRCSAHWCPIERPIELLDVGSVEIKCPRLARWGPAFGRTHEGTPPSVELVEIVLNTQRCRLSGPTPLDQTTDCGKPSVLSPVDAHPLSKPPGLSESGLGTQIGFLSARAADPLGGFPTRR
jgi:hypothetical protein